MGQMTLLRVTPSRILNFSSSSNFKYSSKLTLDNISTLPVAFKIKTTAPKNYLVRPSAGILLTQESKEIELLLERTPEGPDNTRDRFLIQAVPVDAKMKTLTKDFWTDIPRNVIQHHRLNVGFSESEPFNEQRSQGVSSEKQEMKSLQMETGENQSRRVDQDFDPPRNSSSTFVTDSTVQQQKFSYNELLQYCIAVESKKKALALELEKANTQVKQLEQRLNEELTCKVSHHSYTDVNGETGKKDEKPSSHVVCTSDTSAAASLTLWRTSCIFLFILLVLKLLSVF